jgi:hypothetical protein
MRLRELVELIEKNSSHLATSLTQDLMANPELSDIRQVPPDELRQRLYEIFVNLSEWLLHRSESELEVRYSVIGARRATQGVSLATLIAVILAVKERLWQAMHSATEQEPDADYSTEIMALSLVEHFFDRALYFTARAYELADSKKVTS